MDIGHGDLRDKMDKGHGDLRGKMDIGHGHLHQGCSKLILCQELLRSFSIKHFDEA